MPEELTPRIALKCAEELALLKYFPTEPHARAALAKMMLGMIETEEQAQWLVRRTLELHNDWPGPMELRAIFCSRFKPKDRKEANTTDSRFIEDGFPVEQPLPSMALLPAGVSADPEFSRQLIRQTKESLEPKKLK